MHKPAQQRGTKGGLFEKEWFRHIEQRQDVLRRTESLWSDRSRPPRKPKALPPAKTAFSAARRALFGLELLRRAGHAAGVGRQQQRVRRTAAHRTAATLCHTARQ